MRGARGRFRPVPEVLERRDVPTLVFVLNGNGLGAATVGALTETAAGELEKQGIPAIPLANPAVNSPAVFNHLAHRIESISHGQPIAIEGFSAGGLLATRLAGDPSLNVKAVLDFYGPPDLRDWLAEHHGDHAYDYVAEQTHLNPGVINVLSGPSATSAYIVCAFGLHDPISIATESTASFHQDFQHGEVFYYDGAHGVSPGADPEAVLAFIQHL